MQRVTLLNLTADISNRTLPAIFALVGLSYTSRVLFEDLMLIPFDSFPWAGISE